MGRKIKKRDSNSKNQKQNFEKISNIEKMAQVGFILKGSLATSMIYIGGDLTAQQFIEKRPEIDLDRSLRFGLIGFLWAGPYSRLGMARIQKISNQWYHRTALDQTFMMPFNMAMVNMLKPLSDGKSWDEMKEIWLKRYPEVLTKGWAFWTPVMLFSYGIIQAETLRFAFVTFAAYVWQVNLALLMNKNKTEEVLEEVPEETEDVFEDSDIKKPQEVTRRSSLVPERVLVTEKHKITVSRRLSVTFTPIALF